MLSLTYFGNRGRDCNHTTAVHLTQKAIYTCPFIKVFRDLVSLFSYLSFYFFLDSEAAPERGKGQGVVIVFFLSNFFISFLGLKIS